MKSPTTRGWAVPVLALAMSILGSPLLASCAGSGTQASPEDASDQTLTIALTGEPASLDPILDGNLPALNVFYNVFDQLTTIDSTGAVVPALATSWSSSHNASVWTFELNKDAKFQNGSDVTADDVVFTYQQGISNKDSKIAGYLSSIKTVKATGKDEVTFTLKQSFAPFDRQATLVPIIPKAVYQADPAGFANQPVGSGPYSVKAWNHGDSIQLVRNDNYFGKKAAYAGLDFRFVADETTRANSVQSGDLDIALLGASQVKSVKASGAVDVVDQPSNRVLYLGYSTNTSWLKNEKVRRAADLAIDRASISKDLYNGAVEPSGQLLARATFGFDDSIAATSYDPEKAKALLAESGYDGSPIPLSYQTSGLPQIDLLAQAVAGYLEAVGFKVDLKAEEAGSFINDWYAKKLPGFWIFAFAPSIMDGDLPLTMLLKTGGQGYFSNPEIDRLLTEQLAQTNTEKRRAMLQKVSQISKANTYYSPLFIDTYTYAFRKGLVWKPRPDGFFVFN